MSLLQLIGPFSQIITLSGIPVKGPVSDDQLEIIHDGALLLEGGFIKEIGTYRSLYENAIRQDVRIINIEENHIAMPGFVDAHTHICFSGSRARDYALRNSGSSYLEIAKSGGGGIWETVSNTRSSSQEALTDGVLTRAASLTKKGITTLEVKSGYGLSVDEELKMLRAIHQANKIADADILATCLAAHIFPKDFNGDVHDYLDEIINGVFPVMKLENLSHRVDAFIEQGAYSASDLQPYLKAAQKMDFDITIHADQFSTGGSEVAVAFHALSADHLEASTGKEIEMLAASNVIPTALPGASIGLGVNFTPARKILDAGCALAIASDWNPGSAPMGDLLTQAAILGTFEKLSNAEVLAGITCRAAAALGLDDRGVLSQGKLADFIAFPCNDYREILYHQGQMSPSIVWKKGIKL